MIFLMALHMYQIRNFWFEYGAIKISFVPSIISTLPSPTIILIEVVNLNNQISKISRIWKNFGFDAFIKIKVASIKTIAIGETMQNIHHHFNIWKNRCSVFTIPTSSNVTYFIPFLFNLFFKFECTSTSWKKFVEILRNFCETFSPTSTSKFYSMKFLWNSANKSDHQN